MDKKVLVSILAMTSAPSLTAWADANLDHLKTNEVKDWQGATDKVTLKQDVIVSADGTSVSQKIGTLYKGTYVLAAGVKSNVAIEVNGKALGKDGEFEIEEDTKDVTVTLKAVKEGEEYRAGTFSLKLKYDFEANRKKLETMLSEVVNKINKGDQAGKDLYVKSTEISAKIALLVDDKDGKMSEVYDDVYGKFQLYNGLESSTIVQDIRAFNEKVDAQANNTGAYLQAKGLWETQEEKINKTKEILDGYSDENGLKTYAAGVTKARFDTANNIIEDFKKKVDAAYKVGEAGQLTGTFEKFTEEADKAVSAFESAVRVAKDDHEAYMKFTPIIKDLVEQHNTVLLNVTNALKDEKNGTDVYDDLRTKAREELNIILLDIRRVEAAIGKKDNHEGASMLSEADKAKLDPEDEEGFAKSLTALQTTYTDRASELIGKYHELKAEVAGKQEKLDGLNKIQAIQDKHSDAVKKIQEAIDKLSKTIEDANAAHDFDNYNYSEDINGIQTSIKKLEDDAADDIANYNAYEALGKALDKANKELEDAKKFVAELKSEVNKEYSTSGVYSATEKALAEELEAIKTQGDKDFENSDCAKNKEKYNVQVQAVTDKISQYKVDAKQALTNMEKVYTALKDYQTALDELVEATKANTAVPVGDEKKTYGDYIKEYQETIDKVTGLYDKGLKAKDAEHVKGLAEAAGSLSDFTADAKRLVESYDADKAKYDSEVVEKAVETLYQQSKDLIEGTTTKVNAIDTKNLGKRANDIEGKKTDILAKIDKEAANVEKANNNKKENMALAMSNLRVVKKALEDIDKEIGKLCDEANKIAEEVKANNDQYTKLTGEKGKLVSLATDLEKVTATNTDTNRTDEFAKKKSELGDVLKTLKSAVEASYEAETLVKDMDDVKAEGETAAKDGFQTRIENLKEAIQKAITDAENSTNNFNAYGRVKKALEEKDVTKAIENAENALTDNKYTDGTDAYTYYNDSIAVLKNKLADLGKGNGKAYEERTSVKEESGLTTRLTDIKTELGKLPAQIKNNMTHYTDLAKRHDEVLANWSDVYYTISTTDKTEQLKEYQKQLTEIQGKLTDLKAGIISRFGKGGYADASQFNTDSQELTNLETSINNIENQQAADYNKYVAQDNLKRHNAFLDALATARQTYSNAIVDIGQFSNLTNSALVKVATPAIKDANTKLNGILADLRDKEAKELAEYESAQNSAKLFDYVSESEQQKHRFGVVVQKEAIDGVMKTLDGVVSGKAKEIYPNRIENARTDYNAAQKEVKDFAKEAIDAAESFGKANDIITAAENAEKGQYYALSVDKHMNNLEQVPGLLDKAKEEASAKEWEIVYKAAIDLKYKQLKEMSDFKYIPSDAGEKDKDIENYTNALKPLTDEKEGLNVKAAAAQKENKLFSEIGNLKAQLQEAQTKAKEYYDAAAGKSKDNAENIKAHDDVMAQVNEVQDLLNAAKVFTQAYAVTYDEDVERPVNNQQTTINGMLDELAKGLQNGGCVQSKDSWVSTLKTSKELGIPSIYSTANEKEYIWLKGEAETLKGDQNKAADAVEKTGIKEEVEKVETYIATIESLQEDIEKWTSNPQGKNEDIQTKNLYFEKQIATIRYKLSQYYDENIEATTYDKLNASLAEVRAICEKETTDLAACHQPVQDEFAGQLAEIAKAVKETQANLDSYKDAKQTLLYKGKVQETIKRVSESLEAVAKEIAKAQAPYTANEDAYARLNKQLDGFTTRLGKVKATIDGYTKLTDEQRKSAGEQAESIEKTINDLTGEVKASYDKVGLTDDSELSKDNVMADVENLLKRYTGIENNGLIADLGTSIGEVGAYINNSEGDICFTVEDKKQLNAEWKSLEDAQKALDTFNSKALEGYVLKDINGEAFEGDEEGKGMAINYMDEAVQQIADRLAELNQAVSDLNKEAAAKAYVLGDAGRDGKVEADDYMKLLSIVKGTDEMPEAGTVEFLATDANQDGRINIGDVITVVNKILGNSQAAALMNVLAINDQQTAGEVQMASVQGVAGKRIAIKVRSANQYVGCQMDVNLPAGVTVTGESIEGLGDHRLYTGKPADGTLRLVVSSLENAVMDTEGNATIYLDVEGSRAEEITVSNVVAGDAAGITYSIVGQGEATGINGVQGSTTGSSLKQRVYNVGGQMLDSVKKGINIIRNADGSARKVLNK